MTEAPVPVLPTESTARTTRLCRPSGRLDIDSGDVHDLKSLSSREHMKVAPGSLVNPIEAVLDFVLPGGMPVSFGGAGGVVSTFQLAVAETQKGIPEVIEQWRDTFGT